MNFIPIIDKGLCMAGEKITVNYEVDPNSVEMLNTITEQYRLPNSSKALTCLLDYIAESEEDWDLVFKKIRCRRC